MNFDRKLMHRIFLLVAGILVFGWLLLDTARATAMFQAIWDLFSPFVMGAAIAFIFNVPMRAIERQLDGIRKDGLRRTLALLLTLAAMILVIMFVVELLVPQISMTVDSLAARIPAFVERTANSIILYMEENPEVKEWILEFTNLEDIQWNTLLQNTLTFVGNQVSSVMGSAVNVIGSLTNSIVNMVISLVFAVYCLGRKEILARQARRILYSILPEHACDEIIRVMRLTNVTFSNFISGQCLEACILGCLFAIAMSIFKMPYVPLVSVVIAVTALVPVVGAFVGCIIGAFFILVNDPIQAITFVIMFLVIQQLEGNLIYPRVVGSSIGLPGMWVLVAVTVGSELMGIGGMLLMIPLTSVCYTLLGEFTEKRLAQRNIPAEKLQDHPPEMQSRFEKSKEIKLKKYRLKMMKKFQNNQKKD